MFLYYTTYSIIYLCTFFISFCCFVSLDSHPPSYIGASVYVAWGKSNLTQKWCQIVIHDFMLRKPIGDTMLKSKVKVTAKSLHRFWRGRAFIHSSRILRVRNSSPSGECFEEAFWIGSTFGYNRIPFSTDNTTFEGLASAVARIKFMCI